MEKRTNSGALTLEACVTVLLFLVLMLFLSSFFTMFMAQNATGHALLQTSQSLSLDSYSTTRMYNDEDDPESLSTLAREFIAKKIGNSEDNPSFVTDNNWFSSTLDREDVESALKTRFVGYLTGGDESKADKMLKQMNVVNGIDGLDFSGSYVLDGTLYVTLRYEIEYSFNIWGMGTLEVEQTACSKLWK